MRIHYDANGAILAKVPAPQDQTFVPPLAGIAGSLDFDEETNAALVTDLDAVPSAYSVLNGALLKNGQAVTINAASQDYQTTAYLRQAIATFKGTETLPSNAVIQNAFQAVQSGSATLLQTQIVLAVTTRALGVMAQKLIAAGVLG